MDKKDKEDQLIMQFLQKEKSEIKNEKEFVDTLMQKIDAVELKTLEQELKRYSCYWTVFCLLILLGCAFYFRFDVNLKSLLIKMVLTWTDFKYLLVEKVSLECLDKKMIANIALFFILFLGWSCVQIRKIIRLD